MNRKNVCTGIVVGDQVAEYCIRQLIGRSAWFEVMPLPDHEWEFRYWKEHEDVFSDGTEVAYLVNEGTVCPNCGSDSIEGTGGGFDIDGTTASNNMACTECNASWSDIYTLSGIDNLTE